MSKTPSAWAGRELDRLQPHIARVIKVCEEYRVLKRAQRHHPIQKRNDTMRVTKASLEAAVATYADMKKLPGETMPQALDRLAKNRDPLLIALYDEAQSAPTGEDAPTVAKTGEAIRQELEGRVEKQTRAHVARGLTPEQALTKVLAEDPSLYDRWLELN